MADLRKLSAEESEVLRKLLPKGAFPGAEALAKQLPTTSVVCGSEGDFLDLEVEGEVDAAPLDDGPAPVRAFVTEVGETEPVGEVVLWLERGRLAHLEHIRFLGESHGLPPAARLLVEAIAVHPAAGTVPGAAARAAARTGGE